MKRPPFLDRLFYRPATASDAARVMAQHRRKTERQRIRETCDRMCADMGRKPIDWSKFA